MSTKVKLSKKERKAAKREVARLEAEAAAARAEQEAKEQEAAKARVQKEAGRATYRQLMRRLELGGALLPAERAFLNKVERAKVKLMRENRQMQDLLDRAELKRKDRNNVLREVCDLGLSEREAGELIGISGPRVNQIYFGTNGSRS